MVIHLFFTFDDELFQFYIGYRMKMHFSIIIIYYMYIQFTLSANYFHELIII